MSPASDRANRQKLGCPCHGHWIRNRSEWVWALVTKKIYRSDKEGIPWKSCLSGEAEMGVGRHSNWEPRATV